MKTIEIKASDKGFGVWIDGTYKGSHRTEKKAQLFANLLAGKTAIDLNEEIIKSDARHEARAFRKQ